MLWEREILLTCSLTVFAERARYAQAAQSFCFGSYVTLRICDLLSECWVNSRLSGFSRVLHVRPPSPLKGKLRGAIEDRYRERSECLGWGAGFERQGLNG
ncbi:hypothetical protein FB451DRAFT_1242269 [Mycena latifolia]|nr:hypothetical protein FB451DRAFT_1242269 [Mycena latifolia]